MSETFPSLSALERAAMRVVIPVLDRFAATPLLVVDDDIAVRLGPKGDHHKPVPEFRIHHPAVWRAIGRGGVSALGNTFEDGWWSTDDLEGVLSFFISLLAVLPSTPNIDPISRRVRSPSDHWSGLGADDPQVQAQILDKTMFHGTGQFLTDDADLYSASLARFRQICERLELDGNSRVCEIGTGWGAFSLYAARTRGCTVVTVTSSEVEATFAKKRLANAGLTDAVQVKVGPPTSVNGSFDAVVSIDADVWNKSPLVTNDVARLLDPSGLAFLQTNVVRSPALDRSFFGPQRQTLSAIAGSLSLLGCRLVSTTEIVDDAQRAVRSRLANLENNRTELERAGFGDPIYRSRKFCMVRDAVLAEKLESRSVQLVVAGSSRRSFR